MKPVPLLFLGIKRWQDIRPTDLSERVCGGDLTAFAAFYGMGDVEAGTALLRNLCHVRALLQKGRVEHALAFLDRHVGE